MIRRSFRRARQVAVSNGGGGQPLLFETDEALIALGAQLSAIQSFDGFAYSVETTKAAAIGQWFHPFGLLPAKGAHYSWALIPP